LRSNSPGVVCCIESGVLEPMTVRMIESLRRFGGRLASAPVLAVNPRFGPPIAKQTRRRLETLGARYLHVGAQGPYAWYHFMNKVRAVEVAENELPGADVLTFIDCDVLVLDEPADFLLDGEADVSACVPPDASLAVSTGPGHEREPYWRWMADALGMTLDTIPWIEALDGARVRMYLAAGIFAFRRGCGLPRLYRETVTRLLDSNVGIGRNGEHWLEQAALGLAIVRGKLRWRPAPPSHNFEMTSQSRYDPRSLREAKLLHYHDSLRPHFWQEFLRRVASERPEHLAWMRAAGPIAASPAGLPARAVAEAMRMARGVPRWAYRRRYHAYAGQWLMPTSRAMSRSASTPPPVGQEVTT